MKINLTLAAEGCFPLRVKSKMTGGGWRRIFAFLNFSEKDPVPVVPSG